MEYPSSASPVAAAPMTAPAESSPAEVPSDRSAAAIVTAPEGTAIATPKGVRGRREATPGMTARGAARTIATVHTSVPGVGIRRMDAIGIAPRWGRRPGRLAVTAPLPRGGGGKGPPWQRLRPATIG